MQTPPSVAASPPLPPLPPARSVAPRSEPTWYPPLKAILDRVVAAVLLALTAPIIALAMLVVKRTSPGPAIYSQERLGQHGEPFTIFKIRTMRHNCEAESGIRWSPLVGDSRVTPVGRFLRRTHLDELPQLWNVVRGDMSLVGPRPERAHFVQQLQQSLPNYRARLLVRPGITGLAQVQLPPDTEVRSVAPKLACDLHYVEHLTPGLDGQILVGTVGLLLGVSAGRLKRGLRLPDGQGTAHRSEVGALRAEPAHHGSCIQPA